MDFDLIAKGLKVSVDELEKLLKNFNK